jgi:hypothetical protein
MKSTELEFENFFSEARNRFPAWRAGTTTLQYVKYRPTSGRNLRRPMAMRARNWVGLEPSRNQVGTNSGIVPPLPIKCQF